ncbi:hypothetical protein DUI87_16220 [Hirundo rustica rustica]|uniref:RNA-directed DNA polymerase from mobile element jockey n=1 Tax=Hirundo rustica rustica TaxID=333673 RepID=A0A3M0K645_HIRRU|nr:hypothetical protein DUI87_16220 [Hirundo rustica rustica]
MQLGCLEAGPKVVSLSQGGKTTCPQESCPGLVDGVREQNGPPVIQEEAVRELLSHLDVHKSMGPDGIHPRVMRELANELVKLLSVIYHQSWLTGEVPGDWKLDNVTHIHKTDRKEDPATLAELSKPRMAPRIPRHKLSVKHLVRVRVRNQERNDDDDDDDDDDAVSYS